MRTIPCPACSPFGLSRKQEATKPSGFRPYFDDQNLRKWTIFVNWDDFQVGVIAIPYTKTKTVARFGQNKRALLLREENSQVNANYSSAPGFGYRQSLAKQQTLYEFCTLRGSVATYPLTFCLVARLSSITSTLSLTRVKIPSASRPYFASSSLGSPWVTNRSGMPMRTTFTLS